MFQALGMQQGSSAPALPRNQHLSVQSLQSAGPAKFKRRAVEEAEVQQKAVDEMVRKMDLPQPMYEFKELIGKGAYGRVYKSRDKKSGDIVAVKVLDADSMDFEAGGPNKDASMEDALKEINILQRLQQSKAINVNLFHEAFQVHSQLWIVSEYCPGGSITTLRRAMGNKLEERHIIPIARELAKGLKSVHDAGIIHRDIKCSNVMINEDGRLQIIDFGVAGVLLSNLEDDKRKTIIGTPHWMAPEMQKNTAEIAHGTEVDCWAYGITLYECAMGMPPNARTMPGRKLQSEIRQNVPRLPGDRFSKELQDLVAFVLEPDPKKRPAMDKICQQKYLMDSDDKYPTSSLSELVQKFYFWEHSGGSRASLFVEGGAARPQLSVPGEKEDEDEEWNFSTTANFEKKQQKEIIRMSMADPNNNLDPQAFAEFLASSPPTEADEYDEPYDQPTARSFADDGSQGKADLDNETRVARGARAMMGLFDESADPYKYNYGSDLPLRSGEGGDSLHKKEVSVSSSNGGPQIDIKDAPKGRQNRGTMAWKWDDNVLGSTAPPVSAAMLSPPRPQLKHSATEPAVVMDRPMSETIDLDAMLGDDSDFALPQQNQWGGSSDVTSSAPSIVGGDDTEEDDGMIDLDIGETMRPGYYAMGNSMTGNNMIGNNVMANNMMANNMMGNKMMLHAKKESDSSLSLPPSSAVSLMAGANYLSGTTAAPMSGVPSQLPTMGRTLKPYHSEFPWPEQLNPAALLSGAPMNIMLDALHAGLHNWVAGLDALDRKFGQLDTDDGEEGELKPIPEPPRSANPQGPRHGSTSSFGGFSGPGEDVGEHIEGEDSMSSSLQDDDEGHDADAEKDGPSRRWK